MIGFATGAQSVPIIITNRRALEAIPRVQLAHALTQTSNVIYDSVSD